MDIKFISTSSTKLSELPILNGQLIYLSDKDATYYDMGNNRRAISSIKLVSSLPSTADVQEGVLYGLVNGQGEVDASVWDASASTYRIMSGGSVATTTSLGIVKPDGNTITIDSSGTISAALASTAIEYDNSLSGLASTTVQGAIDEAIAKIELLESIAEVALITALPSTAD